MGEFLVHIREPLSAAQRAELERRFPARRRTRLPRCLFLGGGKPRAMVEYARTLGLQARVVDL